MSIKDSIPNNQIDNAVFNGKTYKRREANGTVFYDILLPNQAASSGGASVSVSDTAPTSPSEGDMWYDTINEALYIYIAGTTNGWVQSGAGTPTFSFDSTTKVLTITNV